GIPVGIVPSEGKPAVEVVLTVLHAGGKFGGGGYAVSGGLHGVGMSVVNALSYRFVADVKRDGYHWRQEYRDGGEPVTEVERLEPLAEGESTGTTQTFWADGTIFETTDYDFETLRSRFQQYAFLNKGLQITLRDERAGHGVVDDEVVGMEGDAGPDGDAGTPDDGADQVRTVTFRYDNGLTDYVAHINAAKKSELVHPDIIDVEAEDVERRISVEIAMQWTSSYSESVHTFANTISTTEGGTHEEGFRAALTTLVNSYAREKSIIKEKDENLTGDDIREGLTAVLSVKLGEPQFEGQTKTKLGNTEAKTFVQRVVREKLTDWFDAHPSEARDVIRKAIQASQARMAARKAREATRRKGILSSGGMPGKLKDCQSNRAEDCEVYIVEGDSAGGSAVRGRNPHNQAILPLRGKILNVERARFDRMLSSDMIGTLITALGTGIGKDEFNA
ncbi:MAG: DNA topoisomerase IV subunit B, partial [Actinomycetes bacterium]